MRKKNSMSFITKFIAFVVWTFLCFIPLELWFLMYKFTNPVGFWQNFAIFGLGAWLLGFGQLIGFLAWLSGISKLDEL